MTTLQIKGHITEEGELRVELPEDVQAGDVEITIRWDEAQETDDDIPPTFTDEELAELSKPEPTPFHLIETGIWQDSGIEDSVN
jgi:hypothetical protein